MMFYSVQKTFCLQAFIAQSYQQTTDFYHVWSTSLHVSPLNSKPLFKSPDTMSFLRAGPMPPSSSLHPPHPITCAQ